MFNKKRLTLFGLLGLTLSLILTACAIGQQPEPTPDVVDVDAIYTSAAETAMVQMTEIASLATPTLPPTPTPTEEPQSDDAPLILVTPLADDAADDDSAQPVVIATITPMPGLPTTAAPVAAGTPEPECNSAQWEGETIPDGTKFKAGQTFTKVWKLRNTGTCTWTDGYSFRLIDGNRMNGVDYYFIGKNNHIAPGDAVSMGITMRAPNEPGRYRGYWQLISDQATNYMGFGWPVWVEIEVTR